MAGRKGISITFFLGFIFIIVSAIVIGQLLGKTIPFIGAIPSNILNWVCAVGALFFGLWLIFKKSSPY